MNSKIENARLEILADVSARKLSSGRTASCSHASSCVGSFETVKCQGGEYDLCRAWCAPAYARRMKLWVMEQMLLKDEKKEASKEDSGPRYY